MLSEIGKVVSIDISEDAVNFASNKGITCQLRASATHLPFRDNVFVIITAFDVLEHIEDDRLAMQEFCRVLSGQGIVFLTLPAFGILWNINDEFSHHKRRYTKKRL